ncbi:polysaccharide biosynthesis/export family protein, partial [bacterium]|nr:polysaccharide biosynthesis/export family protein [bacterium]
YQIKPKDILEIKFYRNEDLNQDEIEVTPNGKIFLPLIGEIDVAGLTVIQIEKKLIKLYSQDYLKNPYIAVAILSRKYYVLGEVKSPGSYPMIGNVTVLNAITHAGGFTDYAAKNRVAVIRSKGDNKETIRVNIDQIIKKGDTSLDVILQPDDVVNVPESAF